MGAMFSGVLLCCLNDRSVTEEETYGLWAMRFGKERPKHCAAIGLAAKGFLAERMLKQTRGGESVQWVALVSLKIDVALSL